MSSRTTSNTYPTDTAAAQFFDVRTVTLGINLQRCVDSQLNKLCENIYSRIVSSAEHFVDTCQAVSSDLGIPIVQRWLSVTSIDRLTDGVSAQDLVHVARTLDGAAANTRVDAIGGYSATVQRGVSRASKQLIESMPMALSQTRRVHGAIVAGSQASGIPMEAVNLAAQAIQSLAFASSDRQGAGATKMSVVANPPSDGNCFGKVGCPDGAADLVLYGGVSAPRVIRQALQRRLSHEPDCSLDELANEIKTAAFRAARAAELVSREIAARVGADWGGVDLTLAPSLRNGDSIAHLLPLLGVKHFGSPGTMAALTLMNEAFQAGARFAVSRVAGSWGLRLPLTDDEGLAASLASGNLTLDELSILCAGGIQGLDLVPVPGDTKTETLGAILLDHLSMGLITGRPVTIRLVPIPGHEAGDLISLGGPGGQAMVLPIRDGVTSSALLSRTGRIPAAN